MIDVLTQAHTPFHSLVFLLFTKKSHSSCRYYFSDADYKTKNTNKDNGKNKAKSLKLCEKYCLKLLNDNGKEIRPKKECFAFFVRTLRFFSTKLASDFPSDTYYLLDPLKLCTKHNMHACTLDRFSFLRCVYIFMQTCYFQQTPSSSSRAVKGKRNG